MCDNVTGHAQDLLREDVAAAVQSPDGGRSAVRHELEAAGQFINVAGTDDLLAVHDAGPHTAVPRLALAEDGGPLDVARGGVQGHHGGGHHTGARLPQAQAGVQSAAALDSKLFYYS